MLRSSHASPPSWSFRLRMRVLRAKTEARRQPRLGVFRYNLILKGGSIAEKEKRRPGRPATGRDPVRALRMPPELEAKVAAWIERQPDPKPSRSEAIRRLIEKGLSSG
jgi:hypothetical protein